MKKLTVKYKKWLAHRARNEARRPLRRRARKRYAHLVTVWYGGDVEDVISEQRPHQPPKSLCLTDNADECIVFLDQWRSRFRAIDPMANRMKHSWFKAPKKPNGKRRISGYVDFSEISEVSTSAALILTAEYDRLGILVNDIPPTVNLDKWQSPVFRRLYEIGFFEILGLSQDVADRYTTSGNVRTMRTITGTNASELADASGKILELSKFIDDEGSISEDVELALNNALSEAMINVSKHAYPLDHEFRYRHVSKWWVTASADRLARELTIVVYDQGASIPVTFPKKELSQSVRDFLETVLNRSPRFDYENDGTYIEGAMKPGRSKTNQSHRGLGLPEMKELVDICGRGSLRIISRGGECYYECGRPLIRRSRTHSIGGTLIEWKLHLSEGRQLDA